MKDAAANKAAPLGYVLKCFPRISETFILNEILELERQGLDLRIYSMIRPQEPITHRLAARVRSPINYLPYPLLPAAGRYLRRHLGLLRRYPGRYAATLAEVLLSFDRDLIERFVQAGYLAGELDRDGVDRLHAGFVHSPGSVAWIVHRITGRPFSVATHAKDVYHSKPWLLRKKLRAATTVLTCSRYNVPNLRAAAAPGTIRNLRAVYHGTDLDRFPFGPCGLADPPLVLSVARLVEKKGLEYLIRACGLLRARGRPVQCRIIAGSGDRRQQLLDLIARLGLNNTVTIEGPLDQDEVRAWYRQASVFALPCIVTDDGDRDGIPNVLVESAASGVPLVSTPVGGVPELVRNGETGLIVPCRDEQALAAAIERLLDAPQLREQLRRGARALVEREFDLKRNATEILRELAPRGAVPPPPPPEPPPVPAPPPAPAAPAARPAPRRVGVAMHGVRLNLEVDHPEWLEHTLSLLGDHVCAPWESPDLEVTGQWHALGPEDDAERQVFDVTGLDAFGKRMHIGPDCLVWTDTHRDRNLQLRFHRRNNVPAFDVAYLYRPSAKKVAKFPDYERKKFFDLLRYLVFFPVAWHLERTRGWILLHAAAVLDGAGAVLIAGPGGAGKTTTSVALAARAGMTLLTENLVFSDGAHVYPVHEPVRLTDESLDLLGDAAAGLRDAGAPGGSKNKTMFLLPEGTAPEAVRPAMLFLPQFSSQRFARPIPAAAAGEQLRAANRLTLELSDYDWYTAALDLLWPRPGSAAAQVAVLEKLTSTTPCYALGIDRRGGVEPVVDMILECLHGPAPRRDGSPAMTTTLTPTTPTPITPTPTTPSQAPVVLDTPGGVPIKCFSGDGLLPDARARQQLHELAVMPWVARHVSVLPDVHAKSRNPTPTGTVIVTRDALVPRAIDDGVNCGMRILSSAIPVRALTPDVLDRLFGHLVQSIPLKRHENPPVPREDCLRMLGQGLPALAAALELSAQDLARTENGGRMLPGLDEETIRAAVPAGVEKETRSLGTIGAGNHFLEVQEVAEILDAEAAAKLGIEPGTATFMLHTDSRRLGKRIMEPVFLEAEAQRRAPGSGELWTVPVDTPLGRRYAGALAAAMHAAFANRAAVTTLLRRAVREVLGDGTLELPLVFDCGHETIQHERHGGEWLWVHRHGASRALPPGAHADPLLAELGQPFPLAGCMGCASYLGLAGPGVAGSFHSVPHGAGRVTEKADAALAYMPAEVEADVRARGVRLYRYGEDNIAGQAPASFKDVSRVVEAVTGLGMMRPVARLRPVAVLKG